MTITIRAVYENGVLRPVEPLALPEGETVDVTIATTDPARPVLRTPTRAEADYARRTRAAHSLDELYAVMATAPGLPEGYDLDRALLRQPNRNWRTTAVPGARRREYTLSAAVLLDAGPLGLLSNPNNSPQPIACRAWLASLLAAGRQVVVPEITDYEVRRELGHGLAQAGRRHGPHDCGENRR